MGDRQAAVFVITGEVVAADVGNFGGYDYSALHARATTLIQ